MRTISDQRQMMTLHWPGFEVRLATNDFIVWEGWLAGNEKRYLTSIAYGLPLIGRVSFERRQPRVTIEQPSLHPNWKAQDEAPLPHVYFASDLARSPLCLFDPSTSEWTHNDYIALTTVPWAADWLCCYEIWRATGQWTGGGRHGGDRNLEEAA